MRVLVACEESQVVCKAFRERGHESFSCDLQPCSGGHWEWHLEGDCIEQMYKFDWDMIIAFPPCTDLAVSGARHFKQKREDGRQQASIDFFLKIANWPYCSKIAIENPIGIMSSLYRKPDQIIQPWQFGHGETKATCLWLKGLPKLKWSHKETLFENKTTVDGREQRIWKMAPGPDRAKNRSKTYEGIAKAMAEQWG